jgi:hypothetical protein
MAETILINRPEEVEKIVNIIHDCWFDIDDIDYRKNLSELNIRFEKKIIEHCISENWLLFFKKVTCPIIECFLKIHHVQRYDLHDSEGIGVYDFNTIEFDNEKQAIRILTGVPLDFFIKINQFEISVEITDNILRSEKSILLM